MFELDGLSDSVSLCQADTKGNDNWKGCYINSSSLEKSYHALDKRCPVKLCPCLRVERENSSKNSHHLVLLSEGYFVPWYFNPT